MVIRDYVKNNPAADPFSICKIWERAKAIQSPRVEQAAFGWMKNRPHAREAKTSILECASMLSLEEKNELVSDVPKTLAFHLTHTK